MFKKHLLLKVIACALLVATIVGFAVFASGAGTTAGTSSDPLVTLSYVDETFRAQMLAELQQQLNASQVEYSQVIYSIMASINNQNGTYVPEWSAQTSYMTVTLKQGDELQVYAGQEFLVLSGAGKVSLNMLVDTTAGKSLATGYELAENHFYTAPVDCGITANTDLSILIK